MRNDYAKLGKSCCLSKHFKDKVACKEKTVMELKRAIWLRTG